MSRLIDADALTDVLNDGILNDPNCPIFVAATVEQYIDHAPTVDAEPVRHSKWEICCDGYYPYCMSCGNEPQGGCMTDYCPSCGARMDGGNSDGT